MHIFGDAVAPRGIVYDGCGTESSPQRTFRYWDAASRREQLLGTVTGDVIVGVTASPDGRAINYGGGLLTSDLMMIENFR